MSINPQIFREYDIRGVVGKDLTAETVQQIGQAIGTYMRRQGGKSLVVGRDVRSSSWSSAIFYLRLSTPPDAMLWILEWSPPPLPISPFITLMQTAA